MKELLGNTKKSRKTDRYGLQEREREMERETEKKRDRKAEAEILSEDKAP